MFFFGKYKQAVDELKNILSAVSRSAATIEFKPDGTILDANDNFLSAMGYTLREIQGQHHSIFVDPDYARTPAYADFWRRLAAGEFENAEYRRIAKGGRDVWIQASYNPVKDSHGKTYKVIKLATDTTTQKLQGADMAGQISAIQKSQAVIQFNLDGTIIDANDNFLEATGYTLDEIRGRHHAMFVAPDFASSREYAAFWSKLNRGEYESAQYQRFGKGGREIWIEASYNPIFDMNGQPFKVVKYATDITPQRQAVSHVLRNLDQIEQAVETADQRAVNAAEMARRTTHGVQTVASGAEEMSASVQEISASMVSSMNAVKEVTNQVDAADQAASRLDQAADAMDGIVAVIQGIAGQINLLALNATIEAARAGEAGKGFAVVADEVKNLAKQASDATVQISSEISQMQKVSGDVIESLKLIKQTIKTVEGFVSGTASAVEEQTAVTREITQNMQSASDSVNAISANMGEISTSVQQVNASVTATKTVAGSLARKVAA